MFKCYKIQDLYKLFSTSTISGIFDALKTSSENPEWNDGSLDYLYQIYSDEKLLCKKINVIMNEDISDFDKVLRIISWLASIFPHYLPKWNRLWYSISAEYDPLENEKYKIIREELITDKKNKKTEHENIIDIKTEQNESDTENVDNNSSSVSIENERNHNDDYFYGFNSESGIGTSGTENNNTTNNDSNTRTKQDRQYVSKSDRDSLTKDNLDKTEDENNERNSESMDTHSGNNGRNTFQDLLNQELEFRKNLFHEIVFTDIDSVLTIPVY